MQDETTNSQERESSEKRPTARDRDEPRHEQDDRDGSAAAGGSLDLTGEIRYVRAALALLESTGSGTLREAGAALRALIGLIVAQAKLAGGRNARDEALLEGAERGLELLAGPMDEDPYIEERGEEG